MASSEKIHIEKSAGGIVSRNGEILMVEVKNLKGEIVWTLPKGHLEKGETNEQAAVREVEEETGWLCKIVPYKGGKMFEKVKYCFRRGDEWVGKEVVWYLMKPIEKTGERDPEEIRKVLWVDFAEAKKKISYPSDRKLLAKFGKTPGPRSS